MNGKRVNVTYPGQPKLCRNCLCQGHIAKDCSDAVKADFLDYVARLYKSGLFKEELFGSWIETLKKYHSDYNRPNPEDLRQVMTYNSRGLPRQDLRRHIGYSTASDLRTRIGNPDHQNFHHPDQDQQDYRAHPQQGQDQNYQGYQNNRGAYPQQGQDQNYQGYQNNRGYYRQNNNYRGRGRGRNNRRNFNNRPFY